MLDPNLYLPPLWPLPVSDVYRLLETTEKGLTEEEAKRRLLIFGPNSIDSCTPVNRYAIFGRQFKNPLIIVLLVAGATTLAIGDIHNSIFILAAALINALLGYYQEEKAEAALEHLKSYVTKRVRAIRSGIEHEIDAVDLVPGDLIRIHQGDRIPADARLVHVNDLDTDESILTGEALASHKSNREAPERAPLADQHCMIFSGTIATQGFGTAVVTATDERTQLGRIATLVTQTKKEKTPLQKALAEFAGRATGFVVTIAVLLFAVAHAEGLPLLDSFLIAVAILVAAVPEGLPIVITVILSIGVQRLAKQKAVVRQLSAAETLGSTTIILTDKTGTLTQAKMTLARVRLFDTEPLIKDSVNQEDFLIHTALLNVDVVVENPTEHHTGWRLLGKPLETALVRAAAERNIHFPSTREGRTALHILPFNSSNKFAASVYQMPANWFTPHFKKSEPYVLSILGAPETLLAMSDLPEAERKHILLTIQQMAASGERVVGVAIKEVESLNGFHLKDHTHLHGLRFLGTLSFRDPIRPGVPAALQAIERSGIRVIMVTGDHQGTAMAVAHEIGMSVKPTETIDGTGLDDMTADELAQHLDTLKIVSRISPEGKMKIVTAFQERGEVVAMNGDGINDAPALQRANIGIAMGTGADVSQDVADIVLLDDDFETIAAAVTEGRRILGNIRKAIIYLTSTLLNEILLIGGAIIVGLPLPINPLQILWINFFTDSFPGVALAFEKGLDVTHVPQKHQAAVFTGEMKFLIIANGLLSSILLFATYITMLRLDVDPELAKSFIFAALGTYSLFVVLGVRSLKRSIFSYNPFANKQLTISIVVGLGLTLATLYIPMFQKYFDVIALPLPWLGGVFAFGIINLLLVELTKFVFRRENN